MKRFERIVSFCLVERRFDLKSVLFRLQSYEFKVWSPKRIQTSKFFSFNTKNQLKSLVSSPYLLKIPHLQHIFEQINLKEEKLVFRWNVCQNVPLQSLCVFISITSSWYMRINQKAFFIGVIMCHSIFMILFKFMCFSICRKVWWEPIRLIWKGFYWILNSFDLNYTHGNTHVDIPTQTRPNFHINY